MRAFVAVLAYSGLRISEALGLRWQDWDGAGTVSVMQAKGGRPRWVAVAPCGTAMTPTQAKWIVALANAHEIPASDEPTRARP